MFARYAAAVDAAMESGNLTAVYVYARLAARAALDQLDYDRRGAYSRRFYGQRMLTWKARPSTDASRRLAMLSTVWARVRRA